MLVLEFRALLDPPGAFCGIFCRLLVPDLCPSAGFCFEY